MPRVVLALSLLLVPLFASGIVRAETGAPLWVGLAAGAVVSALVAFAARRALLLRTPRTDGSPSSNRPASAASQAHGDAPRPPAGDGAAPRRSTEAERASGGGGSAAGESVLFAIAGVAASVLMIALLVRRDLGMLVSVGGGDAGNHVSLSHAFATTNPGTYEKFISLYAVTAWLRSAFGVDDFAAFGLALMFTAALLPIAAATVADGLTSSFTPRARRGAAGVLGALLLLCVVRLFGPWVHYHQADGYFAHVFGLVPLCLGWIAYGTARRPPVRIAIVLATVGVQRFTYGLNLGDWLLTAAVIALAESRVAEPRAQRISARVLAGILVVAAAVALHALWPLKDVYGAIVMPDFRRTLAAEAALIVVLVFAYRHQPSRFILLPLAFGMVSEGLQFTALAAGAPVQYYLVKYTWHPLVWLCLAAVAVIARGAAALVDSPRTRPAAVALPIASLLALTLTMSSMRAYWPSFAERAFSQGSLVRIQALSDPALVARARAVLGEHGAHSGGVLDASWPLGNFVNASLDSYDAFAEGYPRWEEGRVDLSPGHCVFWLEGEHLRFEREAQTATWRSLHARADKQCVPHVRAWQPDPSLQLCHACVTATR